ncbi:MAG: hypothetical protein QOJ15_12105, partial [Bradyrhizobium sp.]|nr:hypothetical protein [Bradyrhizobium sp.]
STRPGVVDDVLPSTANRFYRVRVFTP